MARSIWNGVVSFGMVSIPVKLYSATENKDIAFHQLHNVCETRIKYQKWCPHCERTVDGDEIEKGYEYARGQYVVLDEEDFEELPLPSKHTVEVTAFVKMAQLDPIYFEKTYYLEPDEAALRPFALFLRALEDMEMVAIATITLRNKERLCALRTSGGTLLVDTLLYPDEIRVSQQTEAPSVKVSDKELQMATHLIELMEQDFDPEQYHDHYRDALKKLIEAKLEGKEIAAPAEAPKAKVIDLMDALRASVDNIKSQGTPSLKSRDRHASDEIEETAVEAMPKSKAKRQRLQDKEASLHAKRPHAKVKEQAQAEAEKPKRRRSTAAHSKSDAKRTGTTRRRKESA